jgi:EAL domain-containing protein (putative c-di-GMP-specific phosphodiesterase class I)
MPKTCLLERIIQGGSVSVLFQPIMDVSQTDWRIHSVECLTRGPKATNLESAPLLFEYARRKNAENQLDRVCVAQAVRHARALPSDWRFSINVHASTLGRERDFAPFLKELASSQNLDLTRVTIEIVEHLPFWDETDFLRTLSALRCLGVKVALDDIGIGYSNYRMMLDAQPDYFKVDRYLIEGCHTDARRRDVLESICCLARRFNAAVVAEGVSNRADLDTLRGLGLNLVQGYFFARAMTASDLLDSPLHTRPAWAFANAETALAA